MRTPTNKLIITLLAGMLALNACSGTQESDRLDSSTAPASPSDQMSEIGLNKSRLSSIDNTKWQYNADADVYWQHGLSYAAQPADAQQATLGIYVPGKYMTATQNDDGTYRVEINKDAQVGQFTAANAPWVMPINTPGYSAMQAPSGYLEDAQTYTDQGMIYLAAGARGREAGAPAGVTDMKAAIRYVRANASQLAGDPNTLYVFGMSGGGAQSTILGASGDSELYTPYLQAIGAVEGVSDAVTGVMAWCPITNLDTANAAYEWQLGQARSGLDTQTQQLSNGLAEAFATYINGLELIDKSGRPLTLTQSDSGIYQSGTYYDAMKTQIEDALNTFLATTSFPYTVAIGGPGSGPGGAGGAGGLGGPAGAPPAGEAPPSGGFGSGSRQGSEFTDSGQPTEGVPSDNIQRTKMSSGLDLSGQTFNTVEDYISALNADGHWVTYDANTKQATISSVADFVKRLKPPSKDVGAFDALDASQGENELFGYGDGQGAHFDSTMAALLEGTTYATAFNEDLKKVDKLGTAVNTRVDMYNPMYYLNAVYKGYETSKVAPNWRIRSGINQGDTALSTETNLALALQQYNGVNNVDYATVWGQGHTMAESSGNAEANFITWVKAQER